MVEDAFLRQIGFWVSESKEENIPTRQEGTDLKRNQLGNNGERPVIVFSMYINEIGKRQISDTKYRVLEKTTKVSASISEVFLVATHVQEERWKCSFRTCKEDYSIFQEPKALLM